MMMNSKLLDSGSPISDCHIASIACVADIVHVIIVYCDVYLKMLILRFILFSRFFNRIIKYTQAQYNCGLGIGFGVVSGR